MLMKATTAIITFALIITATFILWNQRLTALLGGEVFKTTYQFLLITVLGGLVSLLYTRFSKEQEELRAEKRKEQEQRNAARRTRRELRQKFYDEFIQNVHEVLRVLYSLRARGVRKNKVYKEVYDECMEQLVVSFMAFDSMLTAVQANVQGLYSPRHVDLTSNLKRVVDYVNDIANEYLDSWQSFEADPSMTELKSLKTLDEFLTPGARFVSEFKEPGDNVRALVQQLLLEKA